MPLSLDSSYTYRVPVELNEEVAIGKRVIVQFGRKRVYSAIIIEICEEPPGAYQAKYLLSVLDDLPVVLESQLKFWKWVSDYYMCTLGEVMNAALPSAMKLESQSKIVLRPKEEGTDSEIQLDQYEKPIIANLEKLGELTIDQVDKLSGKRSTYKLIQSLFEKELIWINEELQGGYKPKIRPFIVIGEIYRQKSIIDDLIKSKLARAPMQIKSLISLYEIDKEFEGVDRLSFQKQNDLSLSAIKSLVSKGILEEFEVQVDRQIKVDESELRENDLTKEQTEIYNQLKEDYKSKNIALLQGVTSSGKTHIYISLIEDIIEQGQQVLYLLPEISLTTQLIRRLQAYFGNRVMVTHSRFNTNERVEVYYKVLNREIDILIAPRSGIFMPFQNLGLIVVDEEHENSFKQNEPNPRYHARDASVVLAKQWGAKILLGSATPSLESYQNALTEKYAFAKIDSRFSGVHSPKYEVVDMRAERRMGSNIGIFSKRLIDALKTTKEEGQQSILFLNRKGYVPITECSECSWTPKCIRCDISLTYYRKDNCMRCHFCGYQTKPFSNCPTCGNNDLKMAGYGTERIEAELKNIIPEFSIQRFDQVTARTRRAYENIIGDFEEGNTDILIGTQMLTKGLDFQNVLTVGILDADHALNFPDFRAYERSFQLMIQVGGRAGRRDRQGTVYIQTNQAQHRVIDQVVNYQFEEMFNAEIEERKKFVYPPFNRLIRISVKHKDYFLAEKAADYLNMLLRPLFGDAVLGPEEPYISRIRGLYLRQLLVKLDPAKNRVAMKQTIAEKIAQFKKTKDYKAVRLVVDVDPH